MTPTHAATGKTPLYWRILRLRNIRPNGWQRAALVEGVLAVSITLVLADVASAWTLLILPAASAAVVKAHDLLTGLLRGPAPDPALTDAEDVTDIGSVTETTTAPLPRGQRRRADVWWV